MRMMALANIVQQSVCPCGIPMAHLKRHLKQAATEGGGDLDGFRLLKMCLFFSVHMQKASSVKTSIGVHVQRILIVYCIMKRDKLRIFS